MAKKFHEIRDPIHVFVRLTADERRYSIRVPSSGCVIFTSWHLPILSTPAQRIDVSSILSASWNLPRAFSTS